MNVLSKDFFVCLTSKGDFIPATAQDTQEGSFEVLKDMFKDIYPDIMQNIDTAFAHGSGFCMAHLYINNFDLVRGDYNS